jgi:hypothetical protein
MHGVSCSYLQCVGISGFKHILCRLGIDEDAGRVGVLLDTDDSAGGDGTERTTATSSATSSATTATSCATPGVAATSSAASLGSVASSWHSVGDPQRKKGILCD